jgi:hypothetical protein
MSKPSANSLLPLLFAATLSLVAMSNFALAQNAAGTPNYVAPADCEGFFSCWQARATATQNAQPRWATPLATVTPRLEQEFRTDFLRQISNSGVTTWNYDNSKGLELIPFRNVELIFNAPPYLQRSNGSGNGFGDLSFLMKYRVFSRNETHGNAILTFFVGGSLPTGSHSNGEANATISPTIAAGKGWGKWDVQSTLGATIPVEGEAAQGIPVAWNTTVQAHIARFFWPEVENNFTHYVDGGHSGKTADFITPGAVFGRFPLSKDHKRLALNVGMGFQTRVTSFSTYNHELIFTARLPF